MSKIPSRDVLKEDFGWEIPVETLPLPSRGVVYSQDSYLFGKEEIQIKAMTAQEEDILTSAAYAKENIVIEKLLESCIIDKNIDVKELISGDKTALMVGIRITGYGPEYPVSATCTSCIKKSNIDIRLDQLEIKRITHPPVEAGKNLFEFVLPVTQKTVRYKYQNYYDTKEADTIQKKYDSLGITKDNSMTNILENSIVSIDSVTDKNKISHFIKNMPVKDSSSLRKFIFNNEPGINMSWKYNCPVCTAENDVKIPMTSEFFWPST